MKVDTYMASQPPGHLFLKTLALAGAGRVLFSRPENCVTVAVIKMDCKQYCSYNASVHTV